MKLKELRCPACNGTLKLDETNHNIAVCEYCRTRYVLEWEGDDARIGGRTPRTENVPEPALAPPGRQETEKRKPGGKVRPAAGVILIAAAIAVCVSFPQIWDGREKEESFLPADVSLESAAAAAQAELTGILGQMAEAAFGKPAGQIMDQELSQIRWIDIRYADGGSSIQASYSLKDPYTEPEAELVRVVMDRDSGELDFDVLSKFTGLTRLDISNYLGEDSLRGLELTGLSCSDSSPASVAEKLDHPELLRELRLEGGVESLEGLELFPNLEKLSVDCYDVTSIAELANAKNLKDLTIENGDEITDFSVFSVMPGLERLYVNSEGLRDAGFVENMSGLVSLGLEYGSMIGLDGLETRADTLTELTVKSCGELRDCSPISALTGLKKLSLELPYDCPQPELSGMTAMQELEISGFSGVSFLRSMPELKRLTLSSGAVDDIQVFSRLSKLEYLKCSAFSALDTDLRFIPELPALKELDLTGVSTYDDISAIFNMPSLETLLLNGAECEIDFGRLQENGSLKRLEMDGIKLYKNVQVAGGNGFYSVDWDNVTLDENTGFLSHYPGLTDLSLKENELTGVEFASELMALETLDISDNYVTDIKPLSGLPALKRLVCTENPISNPRVLKEDVEIIQ